MNIEIMNLLSSNSRSWDLVLEKSSFEPVGYSIDTLNYISTYFKAGNKQIIDLSFIVSSNNSPSAIVPILIRNSLSTSDSEVVYLIPPLLLGSTSNLTAIDENLLKTCIEEISKRLHLHNIDKFTLPGNLIFETNQNTNLDLYLMEHIYIRKLNQFWYLDLSLNLQIIWKTIRASYKSLINASRRYYKIEVYNSENITSSIWSDFKNLHLLVSGRQTRSDETWEIQFTNILRGHGFLVASYENSAMVGGAYFEHTKDESLYGVGAYKREGLRIPISHGIQFTGIEYLHNKGVKRHKLGEAYTEETDQVFSEKEKSISNFKKGFSSNLASQYEYEIIKENHV